MRPTTLSDIADRIDAIADDIGHGFISDYTPDQLWGIARTLRVLAGEG